MAPTTFSFVSPKPMRTGPRFAGLGVASLALLLITTDLVDARSLRDEQALAARPAGAPIMAIIALHDQQITIYDAEGWIMRAPVSSGQKGRETPAGIFSVLQKEADHYSNMYDDAYMPHMQRLTWSGIALHGGPLPGYPASHGCIRMPYDFAERLFDVTRLGMRVIVAPTNVAPLAIDHPTLFQPKPGPSAAAASAAAAAVEEAATKADQARLAAATASRETARVMVSVHQVEIAKLKAEGGLGLAERALAAATSPEAKEQAQDAKTKAAAQVAALDSQLALAKAELQPKLDMVIAAREAASAAENARLAAADAARNLARALEPISVFVSRKTLRLYVRQARQSLLEIPITIQDVDRPIGTHIFTAMAQPGAKLQWSVVSLFSSAGDSIDASVGAAPAGRSPDVGAMTNNFESAKAALDRTSIPQDALDRIAEMVSPGSSLIISDEGLSPETGTATEFIVIMSGEPQGGLKHRRPYSQVQLRYDRLPYWRPPFAGRYAPW
jgi:L,D-transpeptidase catalytic domain